MKFSFPFSGKSKQFTTQPALFSTIVILFFIWGFITLLNDLLIPLLRERLHLSYGQAMLVQFSFFFTYFLMSLPMAFLLNKLKYQKGIIVGLFIIALGCLIFIPADLTLIYRVFLFGLFILASGIVMLQVSANPLITLLGPTKTSSARLTLAQGINSLGYVIAPLIVGRFIVATNLYVSYIIIALVLMAVALFISQFNFHRVDDPLDKEEKDEIIDFALWKHLPFTLGLVGIFFYVGAEVSAGSLIVNYLHLPQIANFSLSHAAAYLSIYWGGAMIGRLIGSYVLTKINASKVLAVCAVANLLLLCGVILMTGGAAMWSLLLLGVFNSIMFPTLFALAIAGLPNESIKNKASGFLIMAIVGGAIIPELQGLLADYIGLQHSFILLLVSYVIITAYGVYINQTISRSHFF
ncbi:sugar MFS transporter [Coxiella burnetii]|uniref:sugar MFS transporter n=1 Tax=Coxiella burnetii TaxID=777 RepID=UPI002230081F|nr:sugar MFS transporter [Coxiella burnetii]